jgi:(p)ppGpp synthase/HD superfamily hydrolase
MSTLPVPVPDLVGHPRGTTALGAPPTPQTAFERALLLALRLHGDDVRKATAIPYLAHLLAVTGLVVEQGGTEEQAVAALLHDAAEDHGGQSTLDSLHDQFGATVARIVAACSDALPEEGEDKPDWLERKRGYLDHLRNAVDDDVLIVSLADKIHNARAILSDLRDLGPEVFDRFSAPSPEHTLEYYVVLADIFEDRLGTPAAAELRRIVDELCGAAGHEPGHRLPGA